MQSKTIHALKNSRVAGLPLAVYLILLAVTIAAAAMGALPDNMLGAMLLLMVLGALVCQKELKQKKLGGVLACWLGAALVILSIDVLMTDMNLRYAADFATPLVLASLAVILQGEEVLRTGRKARLFRLGTAGLLAASTLHSLLVLVQSQSPWLQSRTGR